MCGVFREGRMPSRKIPSSTGSRVCPWHKAFFFASVSFDPLKRKEVRRRQNRLTFQSRFVPKRKRKDKGLFVSFAAANGGWPPQRFAAPRAPPAQTEQETGG